MACSSFALRLADLLSIDDNVPLNRFLVGRVRPVGAGRLFEKEELFERLVVIGKVCRGMCDSTGSGRAPRIQQQSAG